MRKDHLFIFGGILLLFLIPLGLSVSDTLTWKGQYYNSSGFLNDSYIFNFTVYDDLTAGTACWTGSTLINTDVIGYWEYDPTGVSLSCNNQSKDYFLNININATDQSPRRRLVLFEYLREFTSNVSFTDILNNVTVHGNLTASYLFGNGSQLTGLTNYNSTGLIRDWNASGLIINWSTTPSEINWNANYSDYLITKAYSLNETLWTDNFTKYNSTWSSTYNSTYDSYNSTGLIRDWNSTGLIINWSGLGETNWNNNYSTFLTHINWSQVVNGTLYLSSNPYGFYNSTSLQNLSQLTDNLGNRGYTSLSNFTDDVFGNSTIVRAGDYNCTGQVLQNVTINSTGIYGKCVTQSSGSGFTTTSGGYVYNDTATDITFNETKMNDTILVLIDNGTIIRVQNTSWITTNVGNFSAENLTLARIGNCPSGEFVVNTTTGGVQCASPGALTETDPYWTDNFTKYNTSWTSTYNSTYDAYNSTGLIRDWNASGLIINWSTGNSETNWNANYSVFLTHINWSQATNGTLALNSSLANYYLNSNPYEFYNSTSNIGNYSAENSTIVRAGNYDCPTGQVFQNATINSSGIFGQCVTPTASEVDPFWTDNFTKYNASWSSTYNSTYNTWAYNQTTPAIDAVLGYGYFNTSNTNNCTAGQYAQNFTLNSSGVFAVCSTPTLSETDPLWTDNFTKYNSTWSSTYNSTYNTWAYNQTTPAINAILGFSYFNSTNPPRLDEIANPNVDKLFTMANKQLKFTYAAPTTSDGGFEVEATGGFTGDLVHIHQHTGNPSTTDLVHMEATDTDVLPLFVTGTNALVANMTGGNLWVRDNITTLSYFVGDGRFLTNIPETNWNNNYSDYLNTKNYALNDTLWTGNQTNYANYSNETSTFLKLSGGTMTGNINMSSNNVTMYSGYTCYGPSCNSYIYWNGSCLIEKVS